MTPANERAAAIVAARRSNWDNTPEMFHTDSRQQRRRREHFARTEQEQTAKAMSRHTRRQTNAKA